MPRDMLSQSMRAALGLSLEALWSSGPDALGGRALLSIALWVARRN